MQKTIDSINIMNSLLINDTIDIDNIDLLIKQIKEVKINGKYLNIPNLRLTKQVKS